MLKIRLRRQKKIIKRIAANNKRIQRRHQYIFNESMFGFLEVVKHQLRNGGPVQAESFNHLYTLDLYKNTKSKAKLVKTGSGFDMYIQVGYFVPYGQNLEEFTPRIVPLKTLADWATKKNININIQNLRRKLKKNPDYYPILDTLWNDQDYSGLYAKEVLRRLREVWFSA